MHLRIEKFLVEVRNRDRTDEPCQDEMSPGENTGGSYRLFLSDGVLLVQALLESRLSAMINFEDAVAGNSIILKKFRIRRAQRLNGPGEVVFLGIADCEIVRSDMHAQQTQTKKRPAVEYLEGKQREWSRLKRAKVRPGASVSQSSSELGNTHRWKATHGNPGQDSDSDDFETIVFDHNDIDRKRKALHELSINRSFESENSVTPKDTRPTAIHTNPQPAGPNPVHNGFPTTRTTTRSDPRTSAPDAAKSPYPNQQHDDPATTSNATTTITSLAPLAARQPKGPQQEKQQQQQPPYHTLLSLLSPSLPNKSYPCTVFATISWVSPTVLPPRHPHSPFPCKRHVKIHDPSISARHSGITVAVYCDAANFRPRVGTRALLTGVVMQRTVGGEVILNAYERLMREDGPSRARWFEDDERVLEERGWDVEGMRAWWEQRERERENKSRSWGWK